MKRKNTIAIGVAVVLVAALTLYFSKSVSLKDIFKGKGTGSEKSRPAAQQQATAPDQAASPDGTQSQDQSEGEAPTVEIPTDKQQMIGVETVTASVRPLTKIIRTVGTIGYDEKKLYTVNTKFEGWIEKLHVNYTGEYVKSGQQLAEIYSPELLATQKELLNLVKWKTKNSDIRDERLASMLSGDAESIVAAAEQRLRLWDITDEQIRKVEETGKPIRTLTIYSPVKGYVVQKAALQGMKVMPGEKLYDIADLSTVWITADIFEPDIPFVREGQTATINLSYMPGREFSSKIDYIYPSVSGETRTAKARFTISNPGEKLKPQMYTDIGIKVNLGSRLAVPKDAVIDTGARHIVYVDKGDGNFEPREVMTGIASDDMVEIIRGLKAGEKVASAANFLIDSEAQLKGVKPLEMKKSGKSKQ